MLNVVKKKFEVCVYIQCKLKVVMKGGGGNLSQVMMSFFRALRFLPPITGRHDITEILREA
jgi:hypothetical protein